MNFQPHFSILISNNANYDTDELDTLKQDYTIYFAESGESTLKQAKDAQPDLILLDLTLPDMSGFEVLSILKKSDITRNIPIIMTSNLKSVEDEEKALQLGAVDYIAKPFHTTSINVKIKMQIRMAKLLNAKQKEFLTLKTKQEIRKIFFDEIIYVDILGKWLSFHLRDGEIVTIYATLKKYSEILLADSRFARSHKSFILNMDFVQNIEGQSVFMKNDECLPVSKRYRGLKKQYQKWIQRQTNAPPTLHADGGFSP